MEVDFMGVVLIGMWKCAGDSFCSSILRVKVTL